MIILIFAKIINSSLKEIHRIKYSNGSVVERIHSPGNPIPEDINIVMPNEQPIQILNQEYQAYCHHFNVQV